jgi:hypothetical protein
MLDRRIVAIRSQIGVIRSDLQLGAPGTDFKQSRLSARKIPERIKKGRPPKEPPLKVENSLHRCFEPFGSQLRISRFGRSRLVGMRQAEVVGKKSLKDQGNCAC